MRDIDINEMGSWRAEDEENKRMRNRARWQSVSRVVNRILGFFIATGIMFGVAGLCLEYILVKGPSPALRDTFVMTMLETRRFRWIPNIFLSQNEVREIRDKTRQHTEVIFDPSMIKVPAKTEADPEQPDAETQAVVDYGQVDEDGDGIILEEVKGNGFVGYMLTILDPTRVFVGMPNGYGGSGMTLEDMCYKYNALGGINAGGFFDPSGTGTGGQPDGLTVIDGVYYNYGYGGDAFAGFDDQGILHVGYYSYSDSLALNIVNGVSFGPILLINGQMVEPEKLVSGINPRTAIGQRADGAVLMLVIDGRQVHSKGATYLDAAEVMLDHGAINAINMDGGSSTVMFFNGDYVNSCSSENGRGRPLPDAFLFR